MSFQVPPWPKLYILNSAHDSSLLKLFGSPSCQWRKFTCKYRDYKNVYIEKKSNNIKKYSSLTEDPSLQT